MEKIDVSNFFPCKVEELISALEKVDPEFLVFFSSQGAGGYLNPTTLEVYDGHVDMVDVFEE